MRRWRRPSTSTRPLLGRQEPKQLSLLEDDAARDAGAVSARISRDLAKAGILERLETFLAHHTGGDDLGLRLRGEQLAAGVRFVRMIREGDLRSGGRQSAVSGHVARWPMPTYVRRHYPRGKADLYAAFLDRGASACPEGGTSALLTMRNWMFIKQYVELRIMAIEKTTICEPLGDFDRLVPFEEVPDDVVSVCSQRISARSEPVSEQSIVLHQRQVEDRMPLVQRSGRERKRAAYQCG